MGSSSRRLFTVMRSGGSAILLQWRRRNLESNAVESIHWRFEVAYWMFLIADLALVSLFYFR